MVEIIPSVLTSSASEAEELILASDGVVSRVQIDIIDGVFAGNRTIDPVNIKNLDVSLGYDFHLMVKEPINWVQKCIDSYADRIIAQIELMGSQTEFVERVQGEGLRVGVGIDLDTPVNKIEQSLFGLVDVILVMSVKAGFGGQEFDKSALSKIEELVNIRTEQKSAFRICVDGGVKEEVMKEVSLAGADEVSIGRRLFQGDIAANIKRLKELSS